MLPVERVQDLDETPISIDPCPQSESGRHSSEAVFSTAATKESLAVGSDDYGSNAVKMNFHAKPPAYIKIRCKENQLLKDKGSMLHQ